MVLSAVLLTSCVTFEVSLREAPVGQADDLKVTRNFAGKVEGLTFYDSPFVLSWEFVENDGREVDRWLGGDDDEPTYVVREVSLSVAGKTVPIPAEAYWDFCDPPVQGAPYVMASEDQLSVFFDLSDGAGARKVSLDFRRGRYVGRTIHPSGG